jgi:hypothetical protein
MTEQDVRREFLASLPTYLQRDGNSVCTLCGALVGGQLGDQIRHTTWHAMLATLLPPDGQPNTDDPPPAR